MDPSDRRDAGARGDLHRHPIHPGPRGAEPVGGAGHLAIELVQPPPDTRFVHLIGSFQRGHPRIELTLVEDETDALLTALDDGRVDIALIGLGRYDRDPDDLDLRLVAREPVVVATHPAHPLAARDRVTLRALRHEPLITPTPASKLRTTLDRACHDAGFSPDIAVETSHLDVVIALADDRPTERVCR